MACRGPLCDRLLRPLLLAALNTAPEAASAGLAGAVLRETLRKGGRACRPLVAAPGLAAAFVDPALRAGFRPAAPTLRFGRRLRAARFWPSGRVSALDFGEEADGARRPDDAVILAVPALDGAGAAARTSPRRTSFRAIVNAHFKIAPPPGCRRIVGVIGGTAEWVFAFPDRLSVTISAADRLIDSRSRGAGRARSGATSRRSPASRRQPAALADRQGAARHLRRDAGAGGAAPGGRDALAQSASGRRLDRDRPAGDHRGRDPLRQPAAERLHRRRS